MSLNTETQESKANVKSNPTPPNKTPVNDCDLTVGALIKQARIKKGLSQKELASLSGITSVQLCRIERDDCIPSKHSLRALSPHIGIEYTALIVQAGYNNMSGKRIFYKKDGNELDIIPVVRSIYGADSDLLDYFRDFETIGTTENVAVLKLILQAMRKEVDTCNTTNDTDTVINSFFKRNFQALKKFIISSLRPMAG